MAPSSVAGPSKPVPAPKPTTYSAIEAEWRAEAFGYDAEYRDCLLGAVVLDIVDPNGAPPSLRSSLTALPVRSHTAIVGLAEDDDEYLDPEPEPEPTPPPIRVPPKPRRVTFSEPVAPRRAPPPVPLTLAESTHRPHPAAAFDPPRPASVVDAAPRSPQRPELAHRPLSWADAATVAKWPWGARRGSTSGGSTPTSPVGPVTPTGGLFVEAEGKGVENTPRKGAEGR
ncbi:hypothetical protein Q8F55_006541 [Vanrija albida]|uniref:Uncharacterized protein n=1 Tax=Vanrija albida TaxID=181172 RepID=A0ABR3PXF1_9TREE